MLRRHHWTCIAMGMLSASCASTAPRPQWTGPYFGQEHPGNTAVLFAPGILSTGMHDDAGPVFTSDFGEVYYRIAQAPHAIIAFMSRDDDAWSPPEIVPFSGRYSDGIPALPPDGKRIYFGSNRPPGGTGEPRDNEDLWYVERTGAGWGEPVALDGTINTDSEESGPSISSRGTLYFASTRDNPDQDWSIYRSPLVDGRHVTVEKLPGVINEVDAACPCIAPDESFLLFVSMKRAGNPDASDLFVSFRLTDDEWSEPVNLGDQINSKAFDYYPTLSPDGRYMFFVSNRARPWSYSPTPRTFREMTALFQGPENGLNDIYWVSTAFLDRLRPSR